MWLSDVSVQRPVFATVIALLLTAFGILAFVELPLREYPDITAPVVSVQTTYSGASAEVIETQITEIIEGEIAGIAGVQSIESSSRDGQSQINIEFGLDRDIDQATNDVRDRVSRVVRRLPLGIDMPQVEKNDSDAEPIMWLSVSSSQMNLMLLTDYTQRYIVDRLAIIPGVSTINFGGGGRPSMRIWLDRQNLAARGLAVSDIENALRRENIELPAGRIESPEREFSVRIGRNYRTDEDFRRLVIGRGPDGQLIRLGEVAQVEIAPRELRQIFRQNGDETVGMGIVKQSTANTVEVLDEVKRVLAQIQAQLPDHMRITSSGDESLFIRAAIGAVYETIIITTILVGLVTLLFLGSLRAMVIPFVTIPVCLCAAFIAIAAFGMSVNLITLLALVLCIGLVVDDAIVVLENVHRRIEAGERPLLAAFNGARQVAFAVIVTTAVLIAVFVPVIFMQDDVGRLFRELAVTISAAVFFSAVLALSLTPMMCSKLLQPAERERRATRSINHFFDLLSHRYESALGWTLRAPWGAVAVTLAVGVAAWTMLQAVPQEYAPSEDAGIIRGMVQAPEGTSVEHLKTYVPALEAPIRPLIEDGNVTRSMVRIPGWGGGGGTGGIVFVNLAPWGEKTITTAQAQRLLQEAWDRIPGVRVMAFTRSGLSNDGGGAPVQFVLGGPSYDELAQWRDLVLQRIAASPMFTQADADLRETQPQLVVDIDTERAAAMGVSVQGIGSTLRAMMSEYEVSNYVVDGEEYDVLMQARTEQRASPSDMRDIYVRSDQSGALIPLANLITVREQAGAGQLNRYNRMRSVSFSANLAPGVALGEALDFVEAVVREDLPEAAQLQYRGQSLEFKNASGHIYFTLGIALLIVFLVMAAQFESFVHPLVIIMAVPLAIAGGLLGLLVTGYTLNIYSQIGMVMLIGIATKNGILIVEFINQLRDQGYEFGKAVVEGARIRFRPVLMTTAATVMGAVPLMLASGPGSESRNTLGIVTFFGVGISVLLTLFVVPAFYTLFARGTRSPRELERELEAMRAQQTG